MSNIHKDAEAQQKALSGKQTILEETFCTDDGHFNKGLGT